ncbi:hypothetical protein ACM9HF_19950 [Colwellia sp. RE-S-Sl-9]
MLKNMLTIRNILLAGLLVVLQSCGGSSDKERYSISADKTSLTFSAVAQEKSTQSLKVDVEFSGDGLLVGFSPDSTPLSWIKFRTENVTDNSATVYVELLDSDLYIPNLYQTKVRLSTGSIEGNSVDLVHHDIDVSILIAPAFSFKSVAGQNNIASQTITLLNSTDDTWEASTTAAWLTPVLDKDTETKTLTLTSSADISSFTDSGLQQTDITLKNTTTGEEFIIPVELGLDNTYLFASQPHVALVSTPNSNITETVISVSNNAEKVIDWTATTTADWLTLTPLADGNTLKISADTSKVTENATSLADISIESNTTNEAITDVVSVSLFHSTTLTEKQDIDLSNVLVNTNAIATSPSQPLVYVGVNNEIKVFNIYTGELLNTLIASPEGTQVAQFVMHPQGTYLLAQATETTTSDDETSTVTHRYRINLADNTISEIEDWTIVAAPDRIVRLSGRYFVLTTALEFADENLKSLYFNNEEGFNPTKIAVAELTHSVFAIDNTDSSLSKIKRFKVEVNDYTTEKVATNLTHSYHPTSLPDEEPIIDLAVTNDEKNLYLVSKTSEWLSFDGTSFTDNGLLAKEETVLRADQATETIVNEDITSSEDNIVTHSVYLNSLNQPHYIRTIKVPNTSPILYETHINTYSTQQQLMSSISASNNTQLFNISPVDISFSLSAQHIITNDKSSNNITANIAPFMPDTLEVTFNVPLAKPEDEQFIVNLGNIDSGWQALRNEDWIVGTKDTEKPSELIITLVDYNTLASGIYHDEIIVYDVANLASATIKVVLNVE